MQLYGRVNITNQIITCNLCLSGIPYQQLTGSDYTDRRAHYKTYDCHLFHYYFIRSPTNQTNHERRQRPAGVRYIGSY